MASESKTTTTSSAPDTSALGNQVESNLAAADSSVAQRVQALAWVHQARTAQLSRIAANLKAQYGANDAGVKSAEAAVAAAKEDAARAAAVHQQVTTAEPDVAPKGWALHGRVLNAQLAPVSGYTVFLVDSTKSYQQAYGFAYTDSSGYFLLNFSGSNTTTEASATGTHAAGELFVAVADKKAQPVYLSATPLQPVIGSATYQNIQLPSSTQPIGDPPSQIKNVAFPPSTSSKRKTKG